MVVDLRSVANKYFGHDGINAVASFLRETFAGYQISFKGYSNHTTGKYNFVDPIEVCFEETYRS